MTQKTIHEKGTSMYSRLAPTYLKMGIITIPTYEDDSKKPLPKAWNRATKEDVERWMVEFPNAQIGMLLGETNGIIGFDLDFLPENAPDFFSKCEKSPVWIQGARGPKYLFKYNNETYLKIKNRVVNDEIINLEIISSNENGGDRFTVLPPSIHPDTKEPYKWGGLESLDGLLKLPTMSDEYHDFIESINKAYPEATSVNVVGSRNDTIKTYATALLYKETLMYTEDDFSQIANMLVEYDKKKHGDKALFVDKKEYSCNDPLKAATKFCKSLYKTLKTEIKKQQKELIEKETGDVLRGETPIVENLPDIWRSFGMDLNKNDEPIYNESSIDYVFKNWKNCPFTIRYNTFDFRIYIQYKGSDPRPIQDFDDPTMTILIQRGLGLKKLKTSLVKLIYPSHAMDSSYSPYADYLNSLEWDGTPRIHNFFSVYTGCEENEVNNAISKNFWIGKVARGLSPGCQVDTMVILEGPQGTFKSTLVSVLAGEWYGQSSSDLSNKDSFMCLRGKSIVEIPELASFRKTEQNDLKKIITTKIDEQRDPYGFYPRGFPRQCIFMGTTNESLYLPDETGNRRYCPIAIKKILIDEVKRDIDQLNAEAVHLFKAGESWHEYPIGIEDVQKERTAPDPWEMDIAKYISSPDVMRKKEVFVRDILVLGLHIDPGKCTSRDEKQVVRCLKNLGWVAGKRRKENGAILRPWIPTSIVDPLDTSLGKTEFSIIGLNKMFGHPTT